MRACNPSIHAGVVSFLPWLTLIPFAGGRSKTDEKKAGVTGGGYAASVLCPEACSRSGCSDIGDWVETTQGEASHLNPADPEQTPDLTIDGVPPLLVIHYQIPSYAPPNPVWGKTQEDGPGYRSALCCPALRSAGHRRKC